jgi:Cupin domain
MAGYAVTTIDALPSIDDDGVDWRPIQHYFGLTAFGINVYRATEPGTQVIGDHDELQGDHEEIYLVLAGEVTFTVGGESFRLEPGALVVISDPAVRRRAARRDGLRHGPGGREPPSRAVRVDLAARAFRRRANLRAGRRRRGGHSRVSRQAH